MCSWEPATVTGALFFISVLKYLLQIVNKIKYLYKYQYDWRSIILVLRVFGEESGQMFFEIWDCCVDQLTSVYMLIDFPEKLRNMQKRTRLLYAKMASRATKYFHTWFSGQKYAQTHYMGHN